MADIFISYASEDRSRVEPLAKSLEDQGWTVWWDPQIPPGKTFFGVIKEALEAAKCVVVLWSNQSINSEWVLEEANNGKLRGILVPAKIDSVVPPLGFGLIQAADLTDWEAEASHAGFESFLSAISDVAGPPPQREKGDQVAEIPESTLEQPSEVQPEEREIPQPITHHSEPDNIKPSKPKPDATATTRPKSHEPRKPGNAVKFGAAAGVLVLLIIGIWWYTYIPESKKIITNSIGMKLALVPAGSLTMGSQITPKEVVLSYGGQPKWFEDEQPQHPVDITRSFYLQTTEVSQGHWKMVMQDNPSEFKDCGDECPVENVSWGDAQKFIRKLNMMEGTNKYRLPTEAEWEYTCRAGTTTEFSFGSNVVELGDYAWYKDNSEGKIHPVGKKKPNTWGLYDMHGNVYEWCQDWYGDYPSASVVDPVGHVEGIKRVMRGGSWNDIARDVRSAYRHQGIPGARSKDIGFRVALDF